MAINEPTKEDITTHGSEPDTRGLIRRIFEDWPNGSGADYLERAEQHAAIQDEVAAARHMARTGVPMPKGWRKELDDPRHEAYAEMLKKRLESAVWNLKMCSEDDAARMASLAEVAGERAKALREFLEQESGA